MRPPTEAASLLRSRIPCCDLTGQFTKLVICLNVELLGNALALGRDGADWAAQFPRDLPVCFASGEAPQKLLFARTHIGGISEYDCEVENSVTLHDHQCRIILSHKKVVGLTHMWELGHCRFKDTRSHYLRQQTCADRTAR